MAWRYLRSTLGDDDPDTVDAREQPGRRPGQPRGLCRGGDPLPGDRRPAPAPGRRITPTWLAPCSTSPSRSAGSGTWPRPAPALDEVLRIRREHRFPPTRSEAETWSLLGHVDLDQNRLAAAEAAFKRASRSIAPCPGIIVPTSPAILTARPRSAAAPIWPAPSPSLAAASKLTRAAEGEQSPSAAERLERSPSSCSRTGNCAARRSPTGRPCTCSRAPRGRIDPDKARAEIGLGSLLVETGRAGEARRLLEDGLAHPEQGSAGREIPTAARADSELGTCYAALGDRRAEALLRHGYQVLLTRWGPKHPDTRQALDRLRRLEAPAN